MLSQDLDIVNLLEMIKDYKLMKDVFFTQDDRFFLKLQHRDMICSGSTSSEDHGDLSSSANQSSAKQQPRRDSKRTSLGNSLFADKAMRHGIFDEIKEKMDDSQKEFVRSLLKRYEGRNLSE